MRNFSSGATPRLAGYRSGNPWLLGLLLPILLIVFVVFGLLLLARLFASPRDKANRVRGSAVTDPANGFAGGAASDTNDAVDRSGQAHVHDVVQAQVIEAEYEVLSPGAAENDRHISRS